MDEDIDRLLALLDELVGLLSANSQPHWAQWVEADAARIRQGDARGVTHFLSAFGTMGSLNDVVLEPSRRDSDAVAGLGPLDQRFRQLSSEAYALADALRRTLSIEGIL